VPLDRTGLNDRLFCGERCRSYAKDVRYFRRCRRDVRFTDPEVREALRTRLAHLVGSGYDAAARRVPPAVRAEVLRANGGLCMLCQRRSAVEVDHIEGPSNSRRNLQGVCRPCHRIKTAGSYRDMGPEQLTARRAFMDRVDAEPPLLACDDELQWDRAWRGLLAEHRAWRWDNAEVVELTADERAAVDRALDKGRP
jgi:5-methylcytosine-specific restriction endonuclease McrA